MSQAAMFNPMVSLPNSPLPPQPGQRSMTQPPPMSMMAGMLPTVPQAQQVVMTQQRQPPAPVSSTKTAPNNIVISVSDPIPASAPVVTAPMTVTVPPQHRLGGLSNSPRSVTTTTPSTPQSSKTPTFGTPHGYQIQMPDGVSPLTVSPFKGGDDQVVTVTTQSLLSSIPNPVISAVTPSPEKPASMFATKTRASSGSAMKQAPGGTFNQVVGEGGEPEEPEAYEPEVNFVPVIPLPDKVDVVTGEEDEDIIFEERAKLFRFCDDTKEWKERGLGQAKILKDKTSGKCRFVMRWEVTFKICANHSLVPGMKLDKMGSNLKARIWGAQDYADEELETEKFCIRFKTVEIAEKFEAKFVEAVASTSDAVTPKKPEKAVTKEPAESKAAAGGSLAHFAAAQKAASWECPACLTRNDNSRIQCMACEAPRPGYEDEVKKLKEKEEAAKPVMTIGAGGGFKFGSGTTSSSSGGFSFGGAAAPSNTDSTTTPKAATSGFSFGTPSSKAAPSSLSFGTPSTTATATTNGDAKSPFGATSGHQFSFSGVKTSPTKPTSPRKHNESTTSENEYYQDDENDNLYFEPVIPLPDKVDVKTGEEDETVLYSHRAKLFRYVEGEWKERG